MSNDVGRLDIVRATLASAVAFGVFFALCWIGIFLNVPVSHMFIQLFTARPMLSAAAFGEGLLWSVAFGGLVAFLIATTYNLIPIGRR